MVNFKVTDGRTTRRFQMNAGEHNYDQLKDRLASLFPEAMKDNQELHLYYTDSDGDQITISTDAEFQEVLQQLPTDATWKLHIRPQRKQQTTHSLSTGRPLYSNPPTRRRVAWLPLSHPYSHPFSSFWDFPSWSALDTGFEDALHQQLEALSKVSMEDKDKQESSGSASSENQPVKENEGGNSKVSKMTESSVPGLKVRNFGSWEPQEYEGPSGRRVVVGPVGYYVSWNSESTTEQEDKKKEQEAGGEEKNVKEEAAGGEEKTVKEEAAGGEEKTVKEEAACGED